MKPALAPRTDRRPLSPLFLAATLAMFAADTASAQAHPDFSGRWTVAADDAGPGRGARAGRGDAAGRGAARGRGGQGRGAPGDMGSGWGNTINIAQDANRMSVEYVFFTRGDLQPPLKFEYALDGSETTSTVMMGRGMQPQRSTAAWSGNRLVITTLHPFTDPSSGRALNAQVRRTLTLESRDTLIVDALRAGVLGGPPDTTRTVYTRATSGGAL
jgi:hypothetical protein